MNGDITLNKTDILRIIIKDIENRFPESEIKDIGYDLNDADEGKVYIYVQLSEKE